MTDERNELNNIPDESVPVADAKTQRRKFIRKDTFALRKSPVFAIVVVLLFTMGIVLMPGEKLGALILGQKGMDARNLGNALFRTVGIAVAVWLTLDLGFDEFGFRGRGVGLLLSLPFLAVAVNNLPIVGLARGTVNVSANAGSVAIFTYYCLSVGFFEEIIFRGVVFPLVLSAAKKTRVGTFWSLIIASALFGGIHIVNLLSSDPLSVLAQVGYSFLVGAMCGMVMLMCRNVAACGVLHALFNFCGLIADSEFLGTGVLWDAASIALTAAVAVIATGYGVWLMLKRVDTDSLPPLYGVRPPDRAE